MFLHPSMTDAELLRATSLAESHLIRILSDRLRDRSYLLGQIWTHWQAIPAHEVETAKGIQVMPCTVKLIQFIDQIDNEDGKPC
jgi:hypothetical protein